MQDERSGPWDRSAPLPRAPRARARLVRCDGGSLALAGALEPRLDPFQTLGEIRVLVPQGRELVVLLGAQLPQRLDDDRGQPALGDVERNARLVALRLDAEYAHGAATITALACRTRPLLYLSIA